MKNTMFSTITIPAVEFWIGVEFAFKYSSLSIPTRSILLVFAITGRHSETNKLELSYKILNFISNRNNKLISPEVLTSAKLPDDSLDIAIEIEILVWYRLRDSAVLQNSAAGRHSRRRRYNRRTLRGDTNTKKYQKDLNLATLFLPLNLTTHFFAASQ
jgi:hypothetical protein